MANLRKTFGKLTIPLLVLLAICFSALPAQGKYGGGTGEPNDPYLIYDANQMNAIGADSNDWDKHFKLMADIDLSEYTGTEFNIIGTGHFECPTMICWFVGTPFTGVFDGNGHSICNFTYEYNGNEFIGLFGCVDGENAQIKNLGLRDVDIDADYGDRVGSLIGLLFNGTVINCYTLGGSVSGDYRVGGLVGRSDDPASICNCYTDVNVSSHADIGGLVGTNSGTISNCYSKTSAIGVYYVGGFVGFNSGTITDCYLTGNVSGAYNVGGLVGENRGTINNCYSNGNFEGETHVGGLVGSNSGITTDCYSTGSVSGYDDVSGLVGLNWVGTITNCYTTCDVEGTECVGGLVGFNRRTVVNCYATGSVSGTINVGGLVGRNGGQRLSGVITNCYSTAPVMGTTNVGGLVGINEDGTVTFSFWDVNKSGLDYSDGGVGKTTADMQTMSTFTDAGWDFAGEYKNGPSDDWAEPLSRGYMILWWQLSPPPELPTFSGGTGEPNDPYLILTAAELNHIGHNPRLMSRHFKLIDDIDLTGTNFFIIGNSVFPFTGTFDGNGKTISNFIYRRTNQDETGFFTCVNNMQSQIKDLYLKDSCVEATNTDFVGALCGRLAAGTITDCHTEGCSVLGKRYIGGLVGFNTYGTISNCTSSGSVSGGGQGSFLGSGYVGGLVGSNSGIIYNCTSASSVISGNDDAVGGLVGKHMHISNSDFEIRNCYASGLVSANRWVGGLVGKNHGPISNCGSSCSALGNNEVGGLVGFNNSRIRNCYSTGSISGTTYVGGLAGRNRYKIYDCYSQSSVLGSSRVGGLVGWNDNEISKCYSAGSVSGHDSVGGLAGVNEGGTVTASFWDIETSGQTTSGGGMGLPTVEMKMASTFMDAGWDFVGERINGSEDIWMMTCEGMSYPKLNWWQPVLGDYFCPDGVDMIDMEHLALHWLDTGCDETNDYCDWAEISNDSTIDFTDFAILAGNWLAGR